MRVTLLRFGDFGVFTVGCRASRGIWDVVILGSSAF